MRNTFVKDYLSFSRKERAGIFILLAVIILCVLLPFVYPFFISHKEYDHSQFQKEVAQLKSLKNDSAVKNNYSKNFDENNYTNYYEPAEKNYSKKVKAELFYFDPNTATTNDWVRLGIREKTAETIQKYVSKGGHFYKPEDISKIWGLRDADVQRLLPYVKIENVQKQYQNQERTFENKPNYLSYKKPEVRNVDINSADTIAFIALPGIGNKLAQRIIAFRNKLGGFYSVDQVKETYGLPDSTFEKIKPKLTLPDNSVKQININTATLDEMKAHPYIRYYLANAILQYRNQHGNYSSVADIKKIMTVTDDVYDKVFPYLTVK